MDNNDDRKGKTGTGISGYIKRYIPKGASIDFIFSEDFDGDGIKEAVVGFTEFLPFPPESYVLYFKHFEDNFKHFEIKTPNDKIDIMKSGIYDNAAAEDIDGDGRPELILSVSSGNGHYMTLYIFDWVGNDPILVWKSEEDFYHGSIEISDIDKDGIYEIIVDYGTMEGCDILSFNESCYYVRQSCFFKWNGKNFVKKPYNVRIPYTSYNTAIAFLTGICKQDYRKIYDMAVIPGFMGLEGLDDSSLSAFRKFVNKKIRPALKRNLSKGKFIPAEPYEAYCQFYGACNDFTVELVKNKDTIKVQCVNVYKKSSDYN